MKPGIIVLFFLIFALTGSLFAQESDALTQLLPLMFAQNDTLTGNYSAFVHANWSQAGVGINIKHVLLMYNKTVLPTTKNLKADMNSNDIPPNLPPGALEVRDTYETIMAGYIINMGRNFYPYFATGTALRTDLIEVNDPNTEVYTVKGKYVTFGTGIIGALYLYRKNIMLEGSVQFKPLLPFVGVGLTF